MLAGATAGIAEPCRRAAREGSEEERPWPTLCSWQYGEPITRVGRALLCLCSAVDTRLLLSWMPLLSMLFESKMKTRVFFTLTQNVAQHSDRVS